jgi:hypothetical protein
MLKFKENDIDITHKKNEYFSKLTALSGITGYTKNELHDFVKKHFIKNNTTKDFKSEDWTILIDNITHYFYDKLDVLI